MNMRVTFASLPERNGQSLYFPASIAGLRQTVGELIDVAVRRTQPVTITIEFGGAGCEDHESLEGALP